MLWQEKIRMKSTRKWKHSILNFPNFAKRSKQISLTTKNLDASGLLHLERKGNSYLVNNFLDYLDSA